MFMIKDQVQVNPDLVDDANVDFLKTIGESRLIDLLLHRVKV